MIKPSEVDPKSKSPLNPEHLVDLEKQFDAAIDRARNAGKWPACVANFRDNCSAEEIEHVADKYRAEGWKVVTGQRTERALIDHPDRKRS